MTRLRLLLSYHYYQAVDIDALVVKMGDQRPEIFADSGGFSAMSVGARITVDEYATWLRRWSHHFSAYANLDVIGDPVGTAANQVAMEERGLTPIPVFHIGSPWSALDAYLERYPYIALGGMVPHGWQTDLRFAIAAFKRAKPSGAVFHGFGVSAWEMVRGLPWYSVDASSWTSGWRYGTLRLFDQKAGAWDSIKVGDRRSVYRHAALLRFYGVDPEDVADRKRYHAFKITRAGAIAWQYAEEYCRRIHGPVPLPASEPGVKIYLAAGTGNSSPERIEGDTVGMKAYVAAVPGDVTRLQAAQKQYEAREA